MARHAAPPLDRPRRTYFDLLDQKYPELARPRRRLVGRGIAVRASSSRWPWLLLGLGLGALLFAGWPFLPGQHSGGSSGAALAEADGWGRLELVPWGTSESPASGERPAVTSPGDDTLLDDTVLGDTVLDHAVLGEAVLDEARQPQQRPARAIVDAPQGSSLSGVDTTAGPSPTGVESVPRIVVPEAPSADLPGAVTELEEDPAVPTELARAPAAVATEGSPPIPLRPDVSPGLRRFAPAPEYPEDTWQAGLVGRVRLEAEVDVEGRVVGARVVEGVAPELDDAAIAALQSWRFEPAVRDGEPHAYRYRVAFDFRPPAGTPEAQRSAVATTEPRPSAGAAHPHPPVRRVSPMPGYPAEAWVRGIEGEVQLRASIDSEGRVTDVRVLRGLPYGLTEAAIDAVKRWRFEPAQEDGRPVAVEHDLRLRFQL